MALLRPHLAAVLVCCAVEAQAGCGSAFCSLNTDWSTQGAWTEPGGRFDLRYEFIDQDQPRTGTRDLAVGEIPQHHDEVRTINRNWIAGYDYSFNSSWGLSIQVPVVSRSHSHIHNHMGAQLFEAWTFNEVGDARAMGRYRFAPAAAGSGAFGLQFGLKLPTGDYKVENDARDPAERSLQPGTGTVDAVAGAFYSGHWGERTTWFADASWMSALVDRNDYRPGNRAGVNMGLSLLWTQHLTLMLQLNAQWKDRDSGAEAEPEDTGGTFVHLSPGFG
ncbi:MAG: hypothetical protein ACREMA_18950, partial [Longimicrobiales bacterium]